MADTRQRVDEVFRALADPSRRRLLDSLNARTGQTLRELCAGLDMARQSVSKHLAILEDANLVTTVRRGREKLHYLNAAPISDIAERWINRYDQQRLDALSDLRKALEETAMDKPEFVYTSYIRTTPEQLWRGLTDPAFTRRYWGLAWESDWQNGSPLTLKLDKNGVTIADPAQVVLESDPYRRLSYTWHTFTPQWAAAYDISDDHLAQASSEPRSKVTFDIEPLGEYVRLTVVHDGFEPGSVVLPGVTQGWPLLMSSLKSLLETGDVLPVG
jgi:DNA-binding transcriptional ArsR family regulator